MPKKVTMKAKTSADKWVDSRSTPNTEKERNDQEPMKRLTIDVPDTLHRRIKAQCANRGVKMNEEIRALLEQHFPAG